MAILISITGLQIVTWILVSVAIILSIGRYVLRYRKTGHFLWDDGAHTVALVTMIALCGVYNDNFWYAHVIDDNALGLGPPLPKDSYIRFLKIQMTVSILFWICIYAVKLSFLLLYRLLFVVSTGSNRAWWSILVFTVLTFWLCIAGELTACGPSKNLFHEKPCRSTSAAPLFHAILIYSCVANVLSDVAIMTFPMLKLRTLQVRPFQKFILATIFSLVFLIIAVDVTRTVVSIRGGPIGAQSVLWGVLESTSAVIVCSLPSYRTLFRMGKKRRAAPADMLGSGRLTADSEGRTRLIQSKPWSNFVIPFGQGQNKIGGSHTDTSVESHRSFGIPNQGIKEGTVTDEETGLELPGIAVVRGWEVH